MIEILFNLVLFFIVAALIYFITFAAACVIFLAYLTIATCLGKEV